MVGEIGLAGALGNESVFIRYHGVYFELAAVRLDDDLWTFRVASDGVPIGRAGDPPIFDTRAEALSYGFGVAMAGLDSILPLVYELVERLAEGETVDLEAEGTIGDVAKEIVEGMLATSDGGEGPDVARLRAAYEASLGK